MSDGPAWRPRGAIVTGAGGGVGAAIAGRLAADGLAVVLADREVERAEEVAASLRGDGRVLHVEHVDIADTASVQRMVAASVDAVGVVDVLVNNAGIMGLVAPVVDYPEEEWQRVIDIDLVGAFRCTQAALPHLMAAGGGRIVNVASISGKEGNAQMTAYAAAKAGLIGFTKALGRELAGTGVLVNCITPAGISGTRILGEHHLEDVAPVVPNIPLGRNALPTEVAALVSWLCSAECSFSTGAVFDISGGRATY